MDIKGDLLLWFTILFYFFYLFIYLSFFFFDKKTAGSGANIHANKSAFNNEKLVKDLHKPIIRKF